MVECDEAALQFFVPHQQLAESVEPTVTDLHNPAPRLFRRVPALGLGFFSTINDMGDVAMRLDDLQGRLAAISGIGAKVLAASNAWRLALDHDGRQHLIELRDVMLIEPPRILRRLLRLRMEP